MRPIKQAGVISTHVLDFFAPVSAAQGAALLLLHVSREAFFFVSACMVTHAYMGLDRSGLGRFYWRRFVSVGIPYLAWTLIYYLYTFPTSHYATPHQALMAIPFLLYYGYYHLYFLLVIMQFYLVFPLLLIGLRRTRRYHGLIIAVAALLQVLLAIAMHWRWFPSSALTAQREAPTYLLYLIGGAITAFHLDRVDAWLRRHVWLVVGLTALAAMFAEAVYYLGQYGVTTALGSTDDPFQPSVIPFNIGAIACLYLVGIALVRSGRTPKIVRMGSDNSYGVYLSHVLFVLILVWVGWARLDAGHTVAVGIPHYRADDLPRVVRADQPACPHTPGGAANRAQAGADVAADLCAGPRVATGPDRFRHRPLARLARLACQPMPCRCA